MDDNFCFYCQETLPSKPYINPYTKETHSTCKQCIKEFTSYAKERKLFTQLGCLWLPIFIIISIIVTFFNWKVGLMCIAAGVILEIIALNLQTYFVKRKDIDCGTYVDRKKLQWCKTCKHFKKNKKYENTIDGLWENENIPDPKFIPCKIFDKTKDIWGKHYELSQGDRSMFPRNCSFWEKR